MPIIGLTHDADKNVRVARTVTVKVAIGLAPTPGERFPKRLDHFVFLRKQIVDKEISWVQDEELNRHYREEAGGTPPREVWVTFLDDDPDRVFRTEYAAYVKRGKWCCGDGVTAQRRDLGRDGTQWGELKVWQPCAEGGCQDLDRGVCSPSGDLYFMLSDFPALGTICRLHTGSYQSIRQIHSALHDLHRITGGRLMGVRAKLFVAPDKNVYQNDKGATVTGTKWVLGLELAASDLPKLAEKMLETARVFRDIRGQLGGHVLEIDEDESERGAELTPEFYPAANGAVILPKEDEAERVLREEATRLMQERGLNEAQRDVRLGQYRGRLPELIERIKATMPAATHAAARGASGAPPAADTSSGAPPASHAPDTAQRRASDAPPAKQSAPPPPPPPARPGADARSAARGGFSF